MTVPVLPNPPSKFKHNVRNTIIAFLIGAVTGASLWRLFWILIHAHKV